MAVKLRRKQEAGQLAAASGLWSLPPLAVPDTRAGVLQLRGTSATHIWLLGSRRFGSSTSSVAFHPPNNTVQWD